MKTFPPYDTMGSHRNTGSCYDFPRIARESGFSFNLYRGRVDWNKIGDINIDKMVRERDFETLQDALSSIMSCSLDNEYDLKVLDPNFVKLFRLAQLSTDFLLYCRNFLDHCVTVIQEQLRVALQDVEHLQKLEKQKNEEINSLRKRLKAKLKSNKTTNSSPSSFKCCVCKKEFVGEQFLLKHQERRHPELSGGETLVSFPNKEVESLQQQVKQLQDRLHATEEALKCNQGSSAPDVAAFQAILQCELQKLKSPVNASPTSSEPLLSSFFPTETKQPVTAENQKNGELSVIHSQSESKPEDRTQDEASLSISKQNSQEPLHSPNQAQASHQAEQAKMLIQIDQQNEELKALHDQLLKQHKAHELEMQRKLEELQLQHRADLEELRLSILKSSETDKNTAAPKLNPVPDADLTIPSLPQDAIQAWEKPKTADTPVLATAREQVQRDGITSNLSSSSAAMSVVQSKPIRAREEPAVQEEYVSPSDQESCISSEDVSSHGSDAINIPSRNSLREHSSPNKMNSPVASNESKSMYNKSRSSSSETRSETESSSSYDSDSRSSNSEQRPSSSGSDGNNLRLQLTPEVLSGLREDLVGLLNRRMQELGIDPEWERLPVASFNSTMATVKHHQNIAAKSQKLYHSVQEALAKEVDKRVAEKVKMLPVSSTSGSKKKNSSGSLSIFARIKSHVKNRLSHSGRSSPHSKRLKKIPTKQQVGHVLENVYSAEPSTSHSKSSNSHEYEVLQEKRIQTVPSLDQSESPKSMSSKEGNVEDDELSSIAVVTSKSGTVHGDATDKLDDKNAGGETKHHLSGVRSGVKVYSRSMYANLNKSEFEFERKDLSSNLSVQQPIHLETSTPIKSIGPSSSDASDKNTAKKTSPASSEVADVESISELESDYNDIMANTSEKTSSIPQARPHTTLSTTELLANVAKFRQKSLQLSTSQSQSIVRSNLKSSLSTGNIMKKKVVFRDEKDGFDTIELGPAHSSYESLAPQRSHSENSLASNFANPRDSDQPVPAPRSSLTATTPPVVSANAESTDSDWDWDKEISDMTDFKQSKGADPSSTGSTGFHSGVTKDSGSGAERRLSTSSVDGSKVADIVMDIEKKLQKQKEKPLFGFNTAGPSSAVTTTNSLTGTSLSYSAYMSDSMTGTSSLVSGFSKDSLGVRELILDDFSSS